MKVDAEIEARAHVRMPCGERQGDPDCDYNRDE